ncbi:MAG: transposase InsO family protein [Yoonia sp.]|jgi:transposase InsO family protein
MRGMDWHTRKVLAWRISNTLEAGFCVDALNEAVHKFGAPDIMNTDQGSQFKSFAWTDRSRGSNVRISMDGKGRFLDNIFVERLWRSLNMNVSTCTPRKPDQRPELASKNGSRSTITSGRIPHLAANYPLWSTGREMKQPNQIRRCKE